MGKFKDWFQLDEVGTSTSCIAGFKRITFPLVTRQWPTESEDDKKKKPYKQPQVEE